SRWKAAERRSRRSRCLPPCRPSPGGAAWTRRPRPASTHSLSWSARPTWTGPSASRRGRPRREPPPADRARGADLRGALRHASGRRIRARRGLLLRGGQELRAVGGAALARPRRRAARDWPVLERQLRAPRPGQAALRAVAPRLHHLAGLAPRRARLAPACVRDRRPAHLLA